MQGTQAKKRIENLIESIEFEFLQVNKRPDPRVVSRKDTVGEIVEKVYGLRKRAGISGEFARGGRCFGFRQQFAMCRRHTTADEKGVCSRTESTNTQSRFDIGVANPSAV